VRFAKINKKTVDRYNKKNTKNSKTIINRNRENPDRNKLIDMPKRIADMFEETVYGYQAKA
jgi:GTP cyclohydrolase I